MKKRLSFLLAVAMLLTMLAGCGNGGGAQKPDDPNPTSGTEEPAPAEKVTTLKIGLAGDTGGFDPATGTTATPQQIIKACYRGLFSVNPDGTLGNELCTSYDVSEDGLVYTFHLRDDVKWSDGVAVTAKDFVYGFQRNLIPELKAAYADLLNGIVNFEACMKGEKELSEFGVKALDDTTLEVTLSHTQPYFVQMTTFSPFFPVREDKVTANSSDWSIDVETTVCNGPFMFESYSPNEKVVLVPNPESYEKDEVKLERIEFYYIPDQQTSVAAFKNGEIDMTISVPTDIGSTHDNPDEVVDVPYLVNNIMVFSNKGNEALKDVRVRQAINMAINREQICQIAGGTCTPLYALIPEGITNPATGNDFRTEGGDLIVEDVEKAKQLMAEAGYPNGEGVGEINYLLSNSAMHLDIAQAIQNMLKTNLGITVNLTVLEAQAFSADRRAGKFDIGRFGTSADYNDPTTFLSLYDSSTAYIGNLTGYETPEYDELMHASELELDPAKRFEMLHEAEEIMIEEAWWLPVLTYDLPILVKDYVKGYTTSTAGDIFVYNAYIEK